MNDYTFVPYNRAFAVEYARRWALSRNPLFPDFAGIGGDCTNFVSQCLLAGTCIMNYTPDFGWYYISPTDRAPAWTSVEYLYDFLVGAPDFAAENGGVGPLGRPVTRRAVMPGDVIQLADNAGDYYHSVIVTEVSRDEILVCAHSDDSLDRPLSSYNYASLRSIHIEAARRYARYPCFENLIGGVALPPTPAEERP